MIFGTQYEMQETFHTSTILSFMSFNLDLRLESVKNAILYEGKESGTEKRKSKIQRTFTYYLFRKSEHIW